MRDIELNPLNNKQRGFLKFVVFLLTVIFVFGYFYFIKGGNNTVYLQDSKLHVFGQIYPLKTYPDKILMHYPYLLIVEGDKPLTTVYNLDSKKKEKVVKDVLLDYYQGNIVYNRKESFYNNKNLGQYCDAAFIKSSKQVLCTTKLNEDAVDNILISINVDRPNLWRNIRQSDNLITTISVIEGKLYIGEINRKTLQNYIYMNNKEIEVPDIVSLIYPLGNEVYFASFKSDLNNQEESFYKINGKAIKQEQNKIVFYE